MKYEGTTPAKGVVGRDKIHGPRLWTRLSYSCNNKCIFCHDSTAQGEGYVSTDEVLKRLEQGLREGFTEVVLSGGEPTIHPEFIFIVKKAKEFGYKWVQTITNGRTFYYKSFCEECVAAGLDEATFSIHDMDTLNYDAMTGVPGSLKQSLKGLHNLLQTGRCVVSVDIVVNKLNIGRLPEILKHHIRLGVREFDLLHLIPFGRAWDNFDSLGYDMEEYSGVLKETFKIAKMDGIRISTNRFPLKMLEGNEHLAQAQEKEIEEVEGHQEIFDDFLHGGQKPQCAGIRCGSCFLESFCRGLFEQESMRRTGKWRNMLWDMNAEGASELKASVIKNRHLWLILREEGFSSQYLKRIADAQTASLSVVLNGTTSAHKFHKIVNREGLCLKRVVFFNSENAAKYSFSDSEIWLPLTEKSIEGILQGIGSSSRPVTFYRPSFFFSPDGNTERKTTILTGFLKGSKARLYSVPPCLAGGARIVPAYKFFFANIIGDDGYIDIVRFGEIYLRYLNYVKSIRCLVCVYNDTCRGLQYDDVTGGEGLSVLAPLVKI